MCCLALHCQPERGADGSLVRGNHNDWLLALAHLIEYGFLCAILLGLASLVFIRLDFCSRKKSALYKTLHITIPKDLDYTDVFQPILEEYASSCELTQVKTTNMGSLFRLTYNLTLRAPDLETEMIDKLRCRNGNLEISVSRQETPIGEL